jgi:hypothetical protein
MSARGRYPGYMFEWAYVQLQDWDVISDETASKFGCGARKRTVFLIEPNGTERDLPAHLGWLAIYNLLGSEGWEFISSAYHNEHSGYHYCDRHGALSAFVNFTMFKKQFRRII